MELDARIGQTDLDIAANFLQQLAQLGHRLAGDDDARHLASALGQRFLHARQPVSIGRYRAQHAGAVALGGVEIDAVQVVARLLRADREAGTIDQPPKLHGRQTEAMRQRPGGHGREILGRQHHQLGVVAAGPQFQLCIAARVVEFDLRVLGQLADDFVQRRRGSGAGAVTRRAGRHVLDDGNFHVGRGQRQRAVAHRQHDVGQDRNGIALLDHALNVSQRLEQGGAIRL